MKVWITQKATYKVSDFVNLYKEGSLILNPDFPSRQSAP